MSRGVAGLGLERVEQERLVIEWKRSIPPTDTEPIVSPW